MSFQYTDAGFCCVADAPAAPSDLCACCGHHRNRHNSGCGCAAGATGDIVCDHVHGLYCQCAAFAERVPA